jgi:hypothetical protein
MKKYTLLTIILVMAIAVFATNASADLLVSSPTIGSDSQARGENTTTTFTITNNGTSDVTSLNFQAMSTDIKYNILFPNAPTTIPAGQQVSATVQGFITEDFDAVDADLKATYFKIGSIKISGTEGATNREATVDLNMQAENNLEFKKVKVEFADKSETVDDGDKVDNIKPGDKLSFFIEVENRFTDNEDVDIEDVEISVEVDDDDFSDSDDDDVGDMGADEEDDVTLMIDVDDDTDDGTFKCFIRVEGTDENGAKHGEMYEFKLEVERKSHEVIIQRTTLSPSTVTCLGRRRADLVMSIENVGRRDEDEITVEVLAPSIGYREVRNDIDLDRDDSTTLSFPIYIPESAIGDIDVTIKTFFDNDKQSDEKLIRISVEPCEIEEDEEEEDTTLVTPTQPVQPTAPTGQAVAQPSTRASSPSSGNTGLFIALLIVGIVIVVGLLALLIVKLVK